MFMIRLLERASALFGIRREDLDVAREFERRRWSRHAYEEAIREVGTFAHVLSENREFAGDCKNLRADKKELRAEWRNNFFSAYDGYFVKFRTEGIREDNILRKQSWMTDKLWKEIRGGLEL